MSIPVLTRETASCGRERSRVLNALMRLPISKVLWYFTILPSRVFVHCVAPML